jgi:iron complex outermembrane recepter protein
MNHQGARGALLASTILYGSAILGCGSAAAQAGAAASAPPGEGSQVTEVVVTGSRIPRANLESTSPLTVVTAGEVKAEGVVSVETLLNNLPQVFAGQNASVSNGSTGTATVDLRGLGPKRTLVLIDGRRLQPGDPTGGAPGPVPNLNFIPAQVCRRAGIARQTDYRWRAKYGGLPPPEIKRIRVLEDENVRLRKLVADLSLNTDLLRQVRQPKA